MKKIVVLAKKLGIMSTADELRQMLKEDKSGKNLYNHLTETLMRLLIDKPTNAYDQVYYSYDRDKRALDLIFRCRYERNETPCSFLYLFFIIVFQFELMSADVKLNPFNPDPEVGRAVRRSDEEVRNR